MKYNSAVYIVFLVLLCGCSYAQVSGSSNIENDFQKIYESFLASPVSQQHGYYNRLVEELTGFSNKQDIPPVLRARTGLLLVFVYIFQNNFSSSYNEITKMIPVMDSQTQNVFSKVKSSIESGSVKDITGLAKMPEFKENAKQLAEKINLLIEGRENYKKSVEQCTQKYKKIFKDSLDALLKENNITGKEAKTIRKNLEQKYLAKIESDGFFLICDLKKDFSQYLFEKLFSD